MVEMNMTNLWNASDHRCDNIKHDGEFEWEGISRILWMYISPIIFIAGLIGNALIVIVIQKPIFKNYPPSTYLLLLALADSSVLIFGYLPEWLSAGHIFNFKAYNSWTCKIDKFVSYSVSDLSVWILTSFTINRFIGICYPRRYTVFGDEKHTKLICFVLLVLAIVKNIHVWWTRGPEEIIANSTYSCIKMCGRPEPFSDFERYVRPWIVFILVICVPFIMIYYCNIRIIIDILEYKYSKTRAPSEGVRNDQCTQVMWMCMSASLAFTVFFFPSVILVIGKPYWDSDDDNTYKIAKAVANQLTYVNHSINFVLYMLTGERFRKELRRSFSSYRKQLIITPI